MAQAMSIHRGSKHENFQTGSRSDAAIQNCKPQGPKPLATTMQRRVADLDDLRIPLMADSDSISIADSVPGDGGHVARVS